METWKTKEGQRVVWLFSCLFCTLDEGGREDEEEETFWGVAKGKQENVPH